ncbi:MAG TPA: DUF5684 domain-containing protein [Mycobacterium sp.]
MNTTPDVGLIVGMVALVVALYAWSGLALSTLFRQFWAKSWKGWVPVLRQAEIFALGGYSPWAVLLLLVPGVNIYGLVLYASAAHRVTSMSGRGAGTTVLAVLLPPVWASVLAWGRTPRREDHSSPTEPVNEPAVVPIVEPEIPQPVPVAAQPVQSAPSPLSSTPVARPAAGPSALSQFEPAARPLLATPTLRRPDTEPESLPSVKTMVIVGYEAPVNLDAGLDIRRQSARWRLESDDGVSLPITNDVVVLGRNPTAAAGEQCLLVPDPTRTLSKTHARLAFADGVWTITDLGATNGVLTIDPTGREHLIDPYVPTNVAGKFMLGEVGLCIVDDEQEGAD